MTAAEGTLAAIAGYAATAPVDHERARLLLADHLACVAAAQSAPLAPAAALAVRAHSGDRDDIFWPARIHPGSVVWPVILAMPGGPVAEAAAAGYEAAAVTAAWLGEAHAARWHATATAGHAGAAAAAAVLLAGTRDPDAIAAAVGLALTTAGGIGQTMRERSPAAAWHRAAAALAGLEAARAAAWGLRPPSGVLDGPAGVGALLGASGVGVPLGVAGPPPTAAGALAQTAIRPYPVNGFAQSAVAAVLALRAKVSTVDPLEVSVAPLVAATGPTLWWDLAATVARAWVSPDPFHLVPDRPPLDVRVHADEGRPVQSVRLWPAGQPEDAVEVDAAPGGPGPETVALAERKWAAMHALEVRTLWTLAASAVGDGDVTPSLRALGLG
ncbi:MmgE/PrpD family protein [Phytohabitans flavus]|uniref:MmgE/PrpD family protein n=1 Tax=Phytohabitans flavus TaxID=1076124 RepID=UPI0036398ABE